MQLVKMKDTQVFLRIWCVERSMILLLIIDQWVRTLSFATFFNRSKNGWFEIIMIYIISMLLWRHNSICFQLYPEVDKASQKNEYMYIYIFETKHFINFVQWSIIFSAQHTFVIILTVITNCTTCNIQRCETWPRAYISDTWLTFTCVRGAFAPNYERGVYPQLTLYSFIIFIILIFYLYEAI